MHGDHPVLTSNNSNPGRKSELPRSWRHPSFARGNETAAILKALSAVKSSWIIWGSK